MPAHGIERSYAEIKRYRAEIEAKIQRRFPHLKKGSRDWENVWNYHWYKR